MKKCKRLLALALAIVMSIGIALCSVPGVSAATKTYTVGVKVKYKQTEARKMLSYMNSFRASKDAWYWSSNNKTKVKCKNLKLLSYDYTLEKMAMQRVTEIAVHYENTRPDGRNWKSIYSDFKYGMYFYGESMGANMDTVKQMYKSWRADNQKYENQSHRRNILFNEFDCVGISCATYNGRTFWVAVFAGSKKINKTKTSAVNSTKIKYIKLKSSYIKYVEMLAKSPIKVKKGKSVALPKVTVNIEESKAWGDYDIPVIPGFKYSLSNTGVAKLQNNKIYGLKKGETILKVKALGAKEEFDIVVKV